LIAQNLAAEDSTAQNLADRNLAERNLAAEDLANQDLAASARAAEVAHHEVEAKKTAEKTAEETRLAAATKAAEDERLATAAKADNAGKPPDPVAAEMPGNSLPEQAAPVLGKRKHPGQRPPGIATAIGKADDLKRIRGIGPRNAGRLHQLGIWHFSQIAAWTEDNVKWVGSYLAFSGRIYREDWVAQARELASGKEISKETKKETNGAAESSPHIAAVKIAASKEAGSPGEGDVQPLK
jgi:predicted flap endonuclease-1-like 5' DNA nuclease